MLDDFQNGRNEFQLLARLATDSLTHFTTARTWLISVGKIMVDNFARQVIGQPSATAASTKAFTDN
jgi:hypothetical protein